MIYRVACTQQKVKMFAYESSSLEEIVVVQMRVIFTISPFTMYMAFVNWFETIKTVGRAYIKHFLLYMFNCRLNFKHFVTKQNR